MIRFPQAQNREYEIQQSRTAAFADQPTTAGQPVQYGPLYLNLYTASNEILGPEDAA